MWNLFLYICLYFVDVYQIFYHSESDIEFYRVHIDSKGKGAF